MHRLKVLNDMTTVGDFLIARLSEWGVTRIFGYPGDGINGVFGALRRKIEFVQGGHEEMAAFMASAHAKFTGALGALPLQLPWHTTELAGLLPGESIASYGAGPVGLMAAHSAMIKCASQIFVVDYNRRLADLIYHGRANPAQIISHRLKLAPPAT